MTMDEKIFNLCVESAKNSKNGYTFDLKEVWQTARKKYKVAKQAVIDAFDVITKEHEVKKGETEGTFVLVELMPKEPKVKKSEKPGNVKEVKSEQQQKEVKHVLTECEVINLRAQKKARELYPDTFTRFGFARLDATSNKEFKNADDAIRGKADMNNLLYVIKVVDGVQYTGTSRINAYENFLAAVGA